MRMILLFWAIVIGDVKKRHADDSRVVSKDDRMEFEVRTSILHFHTKATDSEIFLLGFSSRSRPAEPYIHLVFLSIAKLYFWKCRALFGPGFGYEG